MLNRCKYLLILFCACCFNIEARSLDDILESQYIVIAVYDDYAPFSERKGDVATGIDIDIAQKIALSLGVELRLKWMTAGETTDDDLRNHIWKGHYLDRTVADVMLRVPYDRAYSQKRDDVGLLAHELVHMFGPYHTESWQIVFNQERLPDVPTMALFQYHKIGAEIDSIPHFYLTSAFRGGLREQTRQYDNLVLAIKGMKDTEVDAVMGLRSQISYLHSQLDTQQYRLAENAFPLIGKQKWDIGMAVKTDYRALGYAVGDVVSALVRNGEMQKIFKKYAAIYEKPTYYQEIE